VAERALILRDWQVRAVLEGRKTQHRVPLTHRTAEFGSAPKLFWEHANFERAWADGKKSDRWYLHVPCHRGDAGELRRLGALWAAKGKPNHGWDKAFPDCGPCPECDYWGWRMTSHRLYSRVEPGDTLWVKEPWWPAFRPEGRSNGVVYRADYLHPTLLDHSVYYQRSWTSAQKMGKWASRLTLRVKSVRMQRVQEISEEDAQAEGIAVLPLQDPSDQSAWWQSEPGRHQARTARLSFALFWDSINKVSPWESNPWVAAYHITKENP